MERYGDFSKEEKELIYDMALKHNLGLSREQPYLLNRGLALQNDLSPEERRTVYNGMRKITFALGGIASVTLAIATPFNTIPFLTFAIILFVSRLADIVSTLLCLQMPWMYETNPHCDAHELGMEDIFKHLFFVLLCLAPLYLLSLWLPAFVGILILTYAITSFVASVSNLYQLFSMKKTSVFFFVVSNGAVGTGVLFLLTHIFQH